MLNVRGVEFCHSTRNASRIRSVLTLGSLCLPCCVRDTADLFIFTLSTMFPFISWFYLILFEFAPYIFYKIFNTKSVNNKILRDIFFIYYKRIKSCSSVLHSINKVISIKCILILKSDVIEWTLTHARPVRRGRKRHAILMTCCKLLNASTAATLPYYCTATTPSHLFHCRHSERNCGNWLFVKLIK